jgi:uncharacterized membrane protein
MGILSLVGMLFAFAPCLGSLNWFVIPFAIIGLIISIIANADPDNTQKSNSTAGIVMCGIAAVLGTLRLISGAGIV